MTRKQYWIGPNAPRGYTEPSVGQTGFIVEVANIDTGISHFELREHPVTISSTREPTLYGRSGLAANMRQFIGHGIGRIVRVARNGRYLVEELYDPEAQAVLDELGYPDL